VLPDSAGYNPKSNGANQVRGARCASPGQPAQEGEKLTNVAIIVEDLPPEEADSEGLLLGLFHGIPRTEKSVFSPLRQIGSSFTSETSRLSAPAKRRCADRSERRSCTRWDTTLGSVKTNYTGCKDPGAPRGLYPGRLSS